MTRHTLKKVICLSILGCLLFHDYLGQDKASAHEVKFSSIVKPFLKEHCESCHGAEKDKGDLTLHTLTAKKPDENELKKLQGIYEQLALSIMPPEKKPQPSENSKKEVLKWISDQMASVGQRPFLEFKMKTPEYGNYINHEKLFSGEIKEAPYTPSRIWRSSPEAFNHSANHLADKVGIKTVDFHKKYVKQPYIIPEKIGFKDFSSLYYADEGTFNIIMSNIESVTSNLMYRASIYKKLKDDPNYLKRQNEKKRKKRVEELRIRIEDKKKKIIENAVEELKKKNPKASEKDIDKVKKIAANKAKNNPSVKSLKKMISDASKQTGKSVRIPQQAIMKIYMNSGDVSEEAIHALIDYQFGAMLQRASTKQEKAKLVGFFRECQKGSDNAGAITNVLKAIALKPESIYRMEIGSGAEDQYGRRFLNSANLAYAISLALSDQKIDRQLIDTASAGKLKNKDDVKREVTRLLNDESYNKPRLLRFFREYFGYHRTEKVFKDRSRAPRGKFNSKILEAIEKDADQLVLHILKEDKDVLKNLLTTDKYFISHSGNNENTKKLYEDLMMVYRQVKPICDKWDLIIKTGGRKTHKEKDKISKEMSKELEALGKVLFGKKSPIKWRSKGGLQNFLKKRFGSKARNIHSYFKRCEELKITPNPHRGNLSSMKTQTSDHLPLYNLDPETWSYPLEQPFVLDKENRIGILSHPAWLLSFSHNFETDPINRGKWIQKFLLGGTVPDVPIDVDAQLPHAPKNTLRERFAVTEKEECWKCHEKMNPLGYPFEAFDDFGVFRTHEKLEQLPKKDGAFPTKAVNVTGAIAGTGNPKLDGPVENHVDMIRRLAESDKVRQVFVRHAFRYFMGRNEMLSDSKTLIEADQAYVKSGGSFKALVLSLLTSDSFLYRKNNNSKE